MANIKKITLKDAAGNPSIYSIFDEGALRLNSDGKLITGNTIVDKLILEGDMYIAEIDDVPVETAITNVLVGQEVSTNDGKTFYKIAKRSTNQLLEDIGGISYGMDSSGVLSFKFGKQ